MSKYIKEVIKVSGMTCSGCENIISKNLKKVEGVSHVSVSFKNGTADITYDNKVVDRKTIVKIINDLGYSVYNKDDNYLIATVFMILLLCYIFFKDSNIFNNVPKIKNNMNLIFLFVIGLFTSVHCIFMCGGINISITSAYNENKEKKSIFKPGLLYNFGRLTSYTIIGGIVGFIGSILTFSQGSKDFINIVVGFIMILLGIKMLGIFRNLPLSIKTPKLFVKVISFLKTKIKSPYLIGVLNGFMPCGPLQTMQIYALSTGSFIKGAASMFIFALGTIPLMLIISIATSFMTGQKSVVLKKISAIFILFLGLMMVNRSISFKQVFYGNNVDPSAIRAEIKDDYQEINVRFERGRYKPIVVQRGLPVKWNIIIERGDLNGCNNEIFIPEYNINQKLDYGVNVVEFLPEKSGLFKYSCWMNMIKNSIYVVDNIEKLK